MCEIELFFDVDPKPQKRPRVTRTGTYDPSKHDKEEIQWLAKAQYRKPPLVNPLVLTIAFNLKKPKKCRPYPTSGADLDNLVKLVLDALNGICYEDDAQVVKLVATKQYSEDVGIEVKIEKI